ncbi:hypothetical protein BC832DRAFT_534263 [Gaertneriomyces semiglobifer]|nr:hypothetical protein BC832DRAFT_534263 [Gaertneriomyces semiglobifer]
MASALRFRLPTLSAALPSVGFALPAATQSSLLPTAQITGGISRTLEWLSGLLWAVPKKKTTHRTKRQRMTHKWLKPMRNISTCHFCGAAVLRHHVCRQCVKKALGEL